MKKQTIKIHGKGENTKHVLPGSAFDLSVDDKGGEIGVIVAKHDICLKVYL